MSATNLKRSVVTLAVMAGLLAAAGPASAQGGDRVGTTGLKYETEVTDYVLLSLPPTRTGGSHAVFIAGRRTSIRRATLMTR
jgi:hypothetical protein